MSDSAPPHSGPVGTLAEETLKLLGTLAAGRETSGTRHEHESSCTYCPVCQVIGYVRNTNPETLEHLNASVESLTLAVRGLVEAVASHQPHPKPHTRREAGVENIDLSEDEPWD